MKFEALVTSSGAPCSGRKMVGVPHDGSSLRIVFHTVLPGLDVRGHHERLVLRVALHDHQVLVDDGRARGAPLVLRQIVGAGVEDAEVLRPDLLAVHVEGVEPLRPEERDDVAAIGEGRGVRVGRLDVALLLRHAFVGDFGPRRLAARAIERDDDPSLRGAILGGRAFAVEAGLEGDVGAAADRARHEDPVAPDDRARVRQPGHRDFPAQVRSGGAIPGVRQLLAIGDARGRRPAEAGPVGVGRRAERGAPGEGQSAQRRWQEFRERLVDMGTVSDNVVGGQRLAADGSATPDREHEQPQLVSRHGLMSGRPRSSQKTAQVNCLRAHSASFEASLCR